MKSEEREIRRVPSFVWDVVVGGHGRLRKTPTVG